MLQLLYDKNVGTSMLLLFYDKNIMFVREKKTVSDKPWQNMLHDRTIPSMAGQLPPRKIAPG